MIRIPIFLLLVLSLLSLVAPASPLDDRIAAFREAPTQKEGEVITILTLGLSEARSAQALAAVKPWMLTNPSNSMELLSKAALVGERSGDFTLSASLYRRLLKLPNIDAKTASEALPAMVRLLISQLEETDAAYLFLKQEGPRLQAMADLVRYDRWFLNLAAERKDLAGMTIWLTLIHNGSAPLEPYAGDVERLLKELETFRYSSADLMASVRDLAGSKRASNELRARLNWVAEIAPLSVRMAEAYHAKKELNESAFHGALKAAQTLIDTMSLQGAKLVASGWLNSDIRDTGAFGKYMEMRRAEKAAPIFALLQKLPADQARELLEFQRQENRPVAGFLLSPQELRVLIVRTPGIFNSLNAPNVSFYDERFTMEDAKAMAPALVRNPHLNAAVIRALASGDVHYNNLIDTIAKTEMWRTDDLALMLNELERTPMVDRTNVNKNELMKKYGLLSPDYQKLNKQVQKNAKPADRASAFKAIVAELSKPVPATPGVLPLLRKLMANAPAGEQVVMLKSLQNEEILRVATDGITIGKAGRLPWRAYVYENHFRFHQADTRKLAGDLIEHFASQLRSQMSSGALSETTFGLWLHSVDPKNESALKFMAELMKSPAFAKLSPEYRSVAFDSSHFQSLVGPSASGESPSRLLSKELLELPDQPDPQQVVAAFKTVVGRADQSEVPLEILGLHKVAALPEWSGEIRSLVLSLFGSRAPLGKFTKGYGYEQLVIRIAKDAETSARWNDMEPVIAGLWNAAEASDDPRLFRGAASLSSLASKALEAGQPSIAMSIARCGLNGPVAKAMATRSEPQVVAINGQLRSTASKAAGLIGAVEIPVDETSPTYPIYKSSAEFSLGNLDSAWQLYLDNADQLPAALRSQSIEYLMWLMDRNMEAGRDEQAETIVKDLTVWAREAAGTLDTQQDARLKIAYADLAFRKGALPTARAWYRRVAEAADVEGTEMQLLAALGSVKVDRVSKNYGAAMTELDKLMRLTNPEFRKKVRYARAEVLMDQESFAEALEEVEQVLRQEPKHPDALILRGQIHYQMRKLVEASEIELGPSQDKTVIVPGEAVKINLRDPTLNISGVGADIEVEIKAKSGDVERVLLYQLGDSKEKFRAEVATRLGPPTPGDKVLQILGDDEITYGYSARFRAKMKDLPADPDMVIQVASDARLAVSAGAFPPREGERRLDVEELGISTAQAALGTRAVRPGNPVYLRVTDFDRSISPGVDEIAVSLQTSSGDEIRRMSLKETEPFSGEFQGIVETTGAQALAYASESAPGRDPNMAISSKEYPGWLANVGDDKQARIFGVNMNDNVAVGKMTVQSGEGGKMFTRFLLQTSMDGRDWVTRARIPEDNEVWDGRPHVSSFPTFGVNMLQVSTPKGREIPADWHEAMDIKAHGSAVKVVAKHVKSISEENLPMVEPSHPGYGILLRYRALFHQPTAAIRRFQVTGLPPMSADGKGAIFLIDGQAAAADSDNPLLIERELAPGLHEIQIWCSSYSRYQIRDFKPALLCDETGKQELQPCPEMMFNPASFPEEVRNLLPQLAEVRPQAGGGYEIEFGDQTRARLIRFVILGSDGSPPAIGKVTLSDRDGKQLLPVERDFMSLRENEQLEILPGDQITVRYEDPKPVTPKRNRHEGRLDVAFNDAEISASFLTYVTTEDGRELVLEPIRRFRLDDPVAIIVDDADMDSSAEKDVVEVRVTSADGKSATIQAVETEEHSGRFMGKIFPVSGEPSRSSEIQIPDGGSITASYQDLENLKPGIPTTRSVEIQHAKYSDPVIESYQASSSELPGANAPVKSAEVTDARAPRSEVILPQRRLDYTHSNDTTAPQQVLAGAPLCFDIVVPHLALAGSSTIHAYIQTDAARKLKKESSPGPFDLEVPGSMKLTGHLQRPAIEAPDGYNPGRMPQPPTNSPPLEEGRFAFSVPLILDDIPARSFATKAAESLSDSSLPDGLAVKAGDVVHVAYAYEDPDDVVRWKNLSFKVGSDSMLDVMQEGYSAPLDSAFVGEKAYVRVIDRGGDRGPERDVVSVSLKSEDGVTAEYELQETESHSGIFKGVFALSYAQTTSKGKLPPIALNGFPVRYGDSVTISYAGQSRSVGVNMGADGFIEPFSKRFTGDEMAVTTSFTLAECFFELAKKHREMEQESLARREISQARKLLAEAVAAHRSDEMKAHAEYLLGNLSQEFADLAKNDEAKLPMYQDALSRFTMVAGDFPDSEFAPKSQFKTALVYEKMGEKDNAVEEYVKMAYKYPEHELIPSVMSRLGGYYQNRGMAYKKEADAIRENEDDASKAEVLRLDGLSYPEFLNAAMVFSKLQLRFPSDPLAGLAALRSAQNFMRAHQYEKAIKVFKVAYENEEYDDKEIRSQAMYWAGLSYERLANTYSMDSWKARGQGMREAYQLYRRVTFDFPDSIWAKYARGRLADAVFEKMVSEEQGEREQMIEALKEERKKRR